MVGPHSETGNCPGFTWPHTAVVLAGGGSVRMGRDKARLPARDAATTMAGALAARLATIARRVVVSGPEGIVPGLTHVPDLRPDAGPLAAIEAILASGIDERYLVCPCDMPDLDAATLAPLLRVVAPVVVLHVRGEAEPRPLPLCVTDDALTGVRHRLDLGRRSLRGWLEHARVEAHEIDADAALVNLNTAEDYEAWIRRNG